LLKDFPSVHRTCTPGGIQVDIGKEKEALKHSSYPGTVTLAILILRRSRLSFSLR
jgi:hypothetical protein